MAPEEGLVHPKEYDWRDSNVELIGSDIDHQVKYKSAASEPAWNDGKVGQAPGLHIWRIEDFEVVAWPQEKHGQFHEGDSYIVLHSYKLGSQGGEDKLGHDVFFWLGDKTTQDEAGTAAYKTVELDEFLHGVATQHREIQSEPSREFLHLFPRIKILSGGARSGFRHVEAGEAERPKESLTLLRVFHHPYAAKADSAVVYEVQPTWESLDDDDVFVLEKNDKIWVWQGKNCSPMEKMKAATVVADMTLAKHIDTEVVAQTDARSGAIVALLGGEGKESFKSERPIPSARKGHADAPQRPSRLVRISDESGQMTFKVAKENAPVGKADFDSNDVFLFDSGKTLWVWQGQGASQAERAIWLKAARLYNQKFAAEEAGEAAQATPVKKVVDGYESTTFLKELEA